MSEQTCRDLAIDFEHAILLYEEYKILDPEKGRELGIIALSIFKKMRKQSFEEGFRFIDEPLEQFMTNLKSDCNKYLSLSENTDKTEDDFYILQYNRLDLIHDNRSLTPSLYDGQKVLMNNYNSILGFDPNYKSDLDKIRHSKMDAIQYHFNPKGKMIEKRGAQLYLRNLSDYGILPDNKVKGNRHLAFALLIEHGFTTKLYQVMDSERKINALLGEMFGVPEREARGQINGYEKADTQDRARYKAFEERDRARRILKME